LAGVSHFDGALLRKEAMGRWLRRTIASATSLSVAVAPIASQANPLGGKVTAGTATIQGQGTNQVIVNQSSQSAVINWNTFNIGTGETTHINMPSASSVELDRITGGLGPSQIFGSLYSNGKVFLVNPDGILFGPSSVVNTGSFLATTHNITDSDFMAGKFNFTIPGNPAASIVNQGTITAATGGFAALVAPGVRNDGVITAKLGTVALASGNGFTLDPYGDNLIKLQPSDSIAGQVMDVATGQPLTSLVQNTGTLKANGGQVQLSAVAARQVIDSVINSSGVIEANTVGAHAGKVIFGAATAATKPAGTPAQTVKVSGKISAAGKKPGTKGGLVQITGENIQIANATINVSGQMGGGTILIGGDYHGGSPDPALMAEYGLSLQPWSVPTATTVSVDQASILNASAITSGNGGKVVVWSNQATTFYGTILAKGGTQGGNGGNVETSGQTLKIGGATVSTSAPKGLNGHWLLDPDDFTIDAAQAASINSSLAAGSDVIILTNATGTGGNGDIFVDSSISWSTNSILTLDAYRNVFVNANITVAGTNGALFVYYNDGGTGGDFLTAPGASVTFTGANPLLTINNNIYTLIRTASDLQNISGTGYYALANNVDLSSIPDFIPLGTVATPNSVVPGFSGVFDGLGHTVSNLNVTEATATDYTNAYNTPYFSGAGLFNAIGGEVRNLNLSGTVTVLSAPVSVGGVYAGGLAGSNGGTVINVQANVAVTTGPIVTGAGGLVGLNEEGIIMNSSATGAVNSATGLAGGLVGWNFLNGKISSSFATGSVQGPGAVGGLVGLSEELFSNDTNEIINSYATGSVTGTGANANEIGGLVGGVFSLGLIANSYATGAVTAGNNASNIGGLIGAANGFAGTIQNSFATGAISVGANGSSVGGLIGGGFGSLSNSFSSSTITVGPNYNFPDYTHQFPQPVDTATAISSATATWDFTNIWYNGSNGLPLLRWSQVVSPSASSTVSTTATSKPGTVSNSQTPPGSLPNIFVISYNQTPPAASNPADTIQLSTSILGFNDGLPFGGTPAVSGPTPSMNQFTNEFARDLGLDVEDRLLEHYGIPVAASKFAPVAENFRQLINGNKTAATTTIFQIVSDEGFEIVGEATAALLCGASILCGIAVAVTVIAASTIVDMQLQNANPSSN
jgi:filamentous hemagglutinin family protein